MEERETRKPNKGNKAEDIVIVRNNLSTDHVFVTSKNTPIANQSNVSRAFQRCCKRANIEMHTYDSKGGLIEHLDVHGLRRTFATNFITGGAAPKTVQELLGHKTLTMKIYTKVRGQNQRHAIGLLSYGSGADGPDHTLSMPKKVNPRISHQSVTTTKAESQTEAG